MVSNRDGYINICTQTHQRYMQTQIETYTVLQIQAEAGTEVYTETQKTCRLR